MTRLAWLVLPTLALCLATDAGAVIIDSGDGTGNTSAPSPDPGWAHVGLRGGLTAVHVGDHFVLTANHVADGAVVLSGVTYDFVPGSSVRLQNDDESFADLKIFAVTPAPPLPPLPIATSTPPAGTALIYAGNGRQRGADTSWDPNDHPSPPAAIDGYEWISPGILRWGTNSAEFFPTGRVFNTESFASLFDAGSASDEAQATTGDSGGAAFAWNGSQWELAGVMIAISLLVVEGAQQPSTVSLYGQATYSADLSVYRDQILDVIAMPEPRGGLAAGVALLVLLAKRRRSA